MADATPSTLEILIDIRAKLDALAATQAGMRAVAEDTRDAHAAASELGALFTHGLGIGSGMELARRAVDLFKESFTQAVRQSSQLAAEIERAHGRLGLAGEAYQTLASEARAAGTDFQEMTSSMGQFRQRLGDALLDPQQGSVLRQLGLDAQQLANVPLERQLEQVAAGLGKVSDANVRARLSQELFGRGSAAMAPLLEKLRTEGYDKLRASALETNAVLGEGMADALNRASTQSDEAQKRLGVALAPLNLRLIEAKTQMVNLLAKNAGAIQSGLEASFAGVFAASIEKALEKIEKSGGLENALKNFGKTLAGPVGVGLATALGAFVIKELERHALEANARSNAFDEKAHSTPRELQRALPTVSSDEELRTLYNKAVDEHQKAKKALLDLRKTPARSAEQNENLRSLEQEMQRLEGLIPLIKEKGAAYVAANRAAIVDFGQLKRDQTDLIVIEANHATFQLDASKGEIARREEEHTFLRNKVALLDRIVELTKKLPGKPGDDAEDRAREIAKLMGQRNAAETARGNLIPMRPQSDAAKTGEQFSDFRLGLNANRSARLSPGEGAVSGAQQFVMSLGTQGEQVAAGLQSTLGSTVSSISEAIYGWSTGAGNFGDTVRALESTIFKTFLDTLVNMGVQWLINAALAKGSLISTFLVAVGLRKAETADVIANEAAKAPAIQSNAAGASISSFGLAAALGIAALVVAMAAFGGFRERGGDVQAGRAYVVGEKRPEVFVPDEAGTILPSLDSLPVPAPARARSVAAPSPVAASGAFGGSAGAAAAAKPERMVCIVPDMNSARALQRDPNFESVIVDVVQRRRGEILG